MDIWNDEEFFENYLSHVGVDHTESTPGSGRYTYGSGEQPYQHAIDFLGRIELLKQENAPYYDAEGKFGPVGKTYTGETAIAHQLGLSTTQYRTQKSLAIAEERNKKYLRAERLRDEGYGYTEIARKMGLPDESSVRSLLNPRAKNNSDKAQKTADFLKSQIDEKGMIDIGPGVERELGISRNKLAEAVAILEAEGYVNIKGGMKNLTDPTGTKQINLNVIGPKGSKNSDIYKYSEINFLDEEDYNKFREEIGVKTITEFKSLDNGETFKSKEFVYPESMDSSRLDIRYAEDGGINKDGIIEIRRGVADLDLGDSSYAQVRILVDNNRYLKGMAIYSDDLPEGIDVRFNTNKTKDVAKLDVLKDANKNLAKDPSNPFGSTIKENGGQYYYVGEDGKEHLGLINKTREEGDWSTWKDKLPSQFLAKQSLKLAERQLGLEITNKKQEFNDICDLENDTLKKELLDTFANDCDSAAVHLYAAALPRQKHQVILPIETMKSDEIYAPNYDDGEQVALVRYPHGGTFEIPILTVNNKQKEAVATLVKVTKDCVGINSEVAARLSGADFDGDTVMVIPTNNSTGIKVTSTHALKGLEKFDPKTEYSTTSKVDENGKTHYYNKYGNEVKIMSNTNTQMGIISNLITDMTIAGATEDELARAVRHSMVVIDAEKHKLDYRSSEAKEEIAQLKKVYQGRIDPETGKYKQGAATIISRAKNEIDIPKTQGSPKVNVKYNKNGDVNEYYDETRPEGSLIFKTADANKLNYVSIKEKGSKKELDVYVEEPSTGKYKNLYTKNTEDGYFYKVGKKEVKVTDESLYFNKGNKTTINKDGKEVKVYTKVTDEELISNSRTEKSTQMAQTDNAESLISKYDTKMEHLYANYANTMKALANTARKTAYTTPNSRYSRAAKEKYSEEVESLNSKIDISSKNAPRERQAQVLATSRVRAKVGDNTRAYSKEDLKKMRQQELTKARAEVGAQRTKITITDNEWEAIQAGAISDSSLKKIFSYADLDDVRERATPRAKKEVTSAMISRILAYKNAGRTNAEIAKALGLSATTVSKYTK